MEEIFLKERETFGSRLGFILVSAGCAVGLGNVCRIVYKRKVDMRLNLI